MKDWSTNLQIQKVYKQFATLMPIFSFYVIICFFCNFRLFPRPLSIQKVFSA